MSLHIETGQIAALELHGLAGIREACVVTDLEIAAVEAGLAFRPGGAGFGHVVGQAQLAVKKSG